jgi:hypothetical protein
MMNKLLARILLGAVVGYDFAAFKWAETNESPRFVDE